MDMDWIMDHGSWIFQCERYRTGRRSAFTFIFTVFYCHTVGKNDEGVPREQRLDRNSDRAKELTDAIAKTIIWDLEPYSLVNHRGFRFLINKIAPNYVIPSRTPFSREIIPSLYETEKARIKQIILTDMLEGVSTLAFTTDGWSSRSIEHYMSATVHYITKNFIARKFTLAMAQFSDSQTSKNLYNVLQSTIHDWDLDKESITEIYFTTDNAANITAAIRMNKGWFRIPCIAHTLQLAVKDTVKNSNTFDEVCRKSQKIVSYFSRSTTGYEKLAKAQRHLAPEKKVLKLIQNVDTCWNSQHDMMARLLILRQPLSVVLCEKGMPPNLTESERADMAEYVETLGPVKESTVLMSGETYPTLSQYVPVVKMLRRAADRHMAEMDVDSDDTSVADTLATSFSAALNARFKFVNVNNDPLIFAMVLDPRFKDKLIVSKEDKHEVSKRLIWTANLGARNQAEAGCSWDEDAPSSHTNSAGEPKSKLQKLFDEAFGSEAEESDIESELPMYLHEKVVPRNTDVLNWWSQNSSRFPVLADMAKQYLNIPASQTSSERLFSTGGNIVTPNRAQLLSDHVEQLAFLHENYE